LGGKAVAKRQRKGVIDMSLVAVFGNTPTLKVLDFLRVHSFWDYSIKDISKEAGLSYRTVQKVIPNLIESGLLKYNRTEGKAKLYKINKESAIFKQLQTIAVEDDINAVCQENADTGNNKQCHPREQEEKLYA